MSASSGPSTITLSADKLNLCHDNFALYMALAHETDMPWVFDGRAIPAAHMLPILARMQLVSDIVLRLGEWEKYAGLVGRHTSVVEPPGSGKTTLLQYFYEWLLGRASVYWKNWANAFHMAHVSASEPKALDISFAVKKTIEENPIYHAIFPKVKPNKDEKWADSVWRIKGSTSKDPTFQARGRRGDILGARLNFMGLDDLIKQEEAETEGKSGIETEIEHIISWLGGTAMTRLDLPTACGWMNHTRWREDDPPGWAEAQGWEVIPLKAIQEDADGNEVSYWPERKPVEEFQRLRQQNPVMFSLVYQGEVIPQEGIDFRREHFAEFDYLPVGARQMHVVHAWDTAGTRNPRSDYTAGWTMIVTDSWDVYLVNLYNAKMEFDGVMNAIQGQFAHMRGEIVVEEKSTGQPAVQLLRRQGYPVHGRKPFGERGQPSRELAVQHIKPFLMEQRVHLPSDRFAREHGLAWVPEAKRQIFGYPKTAHDDIVMAMLHGLHFIYEVRIGKVVRPWKNEPVKFRTRPSQRLLV